MALVNVKIRHLNNVKMWPDLIPVKPKYSGEEERQNSPLILSPSSSGESLISCDLMLDYKDGTCSGHVSSDSTLLDEELSVIVTRREDKASREDGILRSEDNNSNISRNMVNVSSNKSLIQTSETGHNNQTTSTVITAMSPSNKSPKVTSTTNFITGSQQNLVNANNTVNNYRIQQSPQQQSNISLRSLKSAYSSPTQLPEPNQNHHSSPKRFNEETRNRSYPPPVRPPNLSRSPCRIPNRNSQTPRTPSPVMPPSRCLKPKSHQSQEIVYSPSKPVAENRNRISDGSVMNNFVQDILNEVTEYKVQLQQLLDVLVSVEKEGEEKDAIIQKQQMEIEFWKTKAIALENNVSSNDTLETTSINTSRKDSNSNRETLNRIVTAEHDIPKLRSGLPTRTAATNLEKP